MAQPTKIVLDTDTGVDDAVAIVLAANSPELDLLAITTVAGNAPVEECTRNCLLLSDLLWPSRPPVVAQGAPAPLERKLLTAPEVHGRDGLGGDLESLPDPTGRAASVPAHRLLADLAGENPGELTLVATGPLTNVAAALREDRGAVASFRRIVIMGGAFDVVGNTGPVAEFNFYVDPEAAEMVVSSGLDITLVPLDATTKVPLMRKELEKRREAPPADHPRGRVATILRRALDYYMQYQFGESGLDGGFMHDPLALASVIAPELLISSPQGVQVVGRGKDRGRSIRDPAGGRRKIDVALDLNGPAFRDLLEDRVLGPVFGR